MVFRERAQCRKAINKILDERKCSLKDLLNYDFIILSDGLRTQVRKMIHENKKPA